jgi:hypothetical protein
VIRAAFLGNGRARPYYKTRLLEQESVLQILRSRSRKRWPGNKNTNLSFQSFWILSLVVGLRFYLISGSDETESLGIAHSNRRVVQALHNSRVQSTGGMIIGRG